MKRFVRSIIGIALATTVLTGCVPFPFFGPGGGPGGGPGDGGRQGPSHDGGQDGQRDGFRSPESR